MLFIRAEWIMRKYLNHFLAFKNVYILSLAVVVLLIPVITNIILGKPLLMGSESYYHLLQAQQLAGPSFHYFPLFLASLLFPVDLIALLPMLLGLSSMLLILNLTVGTKLKGEFVFFFLIFVILSPAFIYNFSTLSANAYFIFLLILGFYLITRKYLIAKYLSTLPFLAASFFNTIFTILTLLSLVVYLLMIKREKLIVLFNLCLLLISGLLNAVVFDRSFLPKVFEPESAITGLVSALGAINGVSFFMLLLGIIGLTITWKKKYFSLSYLFLLILIPAYVYNTELIFLVSLLIIFFATVSFMQILTSRWELATVKNITVILLLLGIIFTTWTYLGRISQGYPLSAHQETLQWIRDNTPEDTIIFAYPGDTYYVKYFSWRKPWYELYKDENYVANQYRRIVSATYLNDLYYLLDAHQISIVYITPDMKKQLAAANGLLSSLSQLPAENFKLVHSYQGIEVWYYKKSVV